MSDASSQSQDIPSPVDFVALSAGRMIGRYEVVSVLGQGGFGITYRARDSQLGREVAIKEYLPLALAVRQDGTTVLPRSTGAAEDFTWGRERFVAEGRTLASLQDAPAIVRVFDFLEANGTAYIVMQLLHGETLESRLKRSGPLKPAEIDRILWPLLDGLEQVHNAGFLHRDIKPANILLDDAGNPTLIDFGASRAAIAGRSTALTAIFTPGYAAAEQMTSAKQGPWTDIYGLSATLYHAITGQTPPSAFDRMLDDAYEPLGKKPLPEFARGLLAGIDTGLAVRASDRPQSIAGWRPILGQAAAPDADATMALARTSAPAPPAVDAPPQAKKRGIGLWIGAAAAVLVVLAGGYFAQVGDKRAVPQVAAVPGPSAVEKAAQDAQLAAQRLKDQEELARLRTEAAAREKAEQEAAQRRQIEEETRRKIEAEMAEKKRLEDAARQKAALDTADRQRQQDEARQKAEADAAAEKRAAETAENGLRLTTLDRQHVQVALGALGFGSAGTDGTFAARTREMIAAWQKTHNNPPTGYLTGTQNQALLRDAAPAVSRFDEEQKKAATPPPPPPPAAPAQVAAVAPPPAATTPPAPAASGTAAAGDGTWQGTYDCQAGRDAAAAPPFTAQFRAMVTNGHGVWVPPVSRGTLSIALQITGDSVRLTRTVANPDQTKSDTYLTGKLSGASITASGHEQPFGRNCTVVLGRIDTPTGVHPSGGGGGAGTGGGAHRRPRN